MENKNNLIYNHKIQVIILVFSQKMMGTLFAVNLIENI